MTILNGVRQRVEGIDLTGYMISCHECGVTQFMPSLKHLPDQVVANKFRENKHWEVNANGRDFCPQCIRKRRRPKYEAPRQAAVSALTPTRETIGLTPDKLQKTLANAGLPAPAVIELELLGNPRTNNRNGARRRFKISLDGTTQFHFGQAIHAESEVLETFGVTMVSSFFTAATESTVTKATLSVTSKLYWYLTIEAKAREFEPREAPALAAAE